ncbi:MAG TPA: inositol monophosphatase family protein [Longimicrobiaceae bacterium]
MDLDNLIDFAVRTAQEAGEITLRHFGRVATERKSDGSEVTAADRESEAFILERLAEQFPEDGVLGEEGGSAVSRSGRRWVVDPIDGTRSFSSGVPLYGVLIALEVDGRPVLGCCHLPALGDTVVAAEGAGAWWNGTRVRVSEVDDLSQARVVSSGLEYWRDWATPEGREGWTRLVGQARFARTWGDCYGYMLVATGRAEIMVDPATGAPWDYLPLIPILHEAGGRFTSLGGEAVGAWTTSLATNGRVHEAAMGCWSARERGDAVVQTEEILARRKAS